MFGKYLRLLGHRAVGSHYLSAGGQSAIQRALAGLERPTPISAGDMPSTGTMLDDQKKSFSSSDSKSEHNAFSVVPTRRHTIIKFFP